MIGALASGGAHPLVRAIRLLATLVLLAASAAASAQSCAFIGGAPAGITFTPELDPSNATVRTAFTDVRIRCTGPGVPPPSSWSFVGLYGTNPNLQMKHAVLPDYIAYSVGNPPLLVSATGANQTYRVTGTILPGSYQNAYAGMYSDTLTVTVLP